MCISIGTGAGGAGRFPPAALRRNSVYCRTDVNQEVSNTTGMGIGGGEG